MPKTDVGRGKVGRRKSIAGTFFAAAEKWSLVEDSVDEDVIDEDVVDEDVETVEKGCASLTRLNPLVNPLVNPVVRLSILAIENLCLKSLPIGSRLCGRRLRRRTTESVI